MCALLWTLLFYFYMQGADTAEFPLPVQVNADLRIELTERTNHSVSLFLLPICFLSTFTFSTLECEGICYTGHTTVGPKLNN